MPLQVFFGRVALSAIIAGLAACSPGLQTNQVPSASTSIAHGGGHRNSEQLRAFAATCASNGASSGTGNCSNIELASTALGPTTPAAMVPGFHPADLQAAYALPSATGGTNQTLGIVIVNNDPKLESDLAVYRSTFGLPACTSATGCLRVIPAELITQADANWSHELSTDVDMASAVCPKCKLLVVEAKSTLESDLAFAVSVAVLNGATVVSNSYVIPESNFESNLNWYHPGVPIVAAAGDAGYTTANWPAASSNVVAVGATTLRRDPTTARGWSETAWAGSGSGCSAIASKPAWQTDSGCKMRTVADVAAVGDPSTPVAVYDSYQDSGWIEMGGTSVSTPIVAGTYALASTSGLLNLAGTTTAAQANPGSYLYAHKSNLFPITTGSNGACSPSYLCSAGTGYSGPAGLGSPNGIAAF